jgi:hypothetical protein
LSRIPINYGSAPNDNTGDTIRVAMRSIDNNFIEIYSGISITSNNVTLANNLFLGNSTVNTSVNTSSIFIGNSTVNFTANTSNIKINSANVTSNTGLTLGSSNNSANGYTFLPNGVKLNWGWVSSNSSAGDVTFTSAFTSNTSVYSIIATSNSEAATYQAAVTFSNNSVASIRTSNATSTNVYWMALGT